MVSYNLPTRECSICFAINEKNREGYILCEDLNVKVMLLFYFDEMQRHSLKTFVRSHRFVNPTFVRARLHIDTSNYTEQYLLFYLTVGEEGDKERQRTALF